MTRVQWWAAVAAIAGLGMVGAAGAATDPMEGDLRDLRVGMRASELPTEGYVNLACGMPTEAEAQAIAGWSEYARCPANAEGLHEVTFEYDEEANPWTAVSDKWEGTKVAGHPIVPTLLIGSDGVVEALRIVTDPDARLYLKKKAFLLPIRIMGRYGRDGWECVDAEPSEGRRPVGGMFIDRHCEKTFNDRHLVMDNMLYRTADQRGQEFTGATRLEIRHLDGDG